VRALSCGESLAAGGAPPDALSPAVQRLCACGGSLSCAVRHHAVRSSSPSAASSSWLVHRGTKITTRVAANSCLPAVRFPTDRDRLDYSLYRARPAYGNPPDLGEHQDAVIQDSAVAELLVGKAGIAPRALKAGHPGIWPACARAKNCWNALSSRVSTSCKTCEWMS